MRRQLPGGFPAPRRRFSQHFLTDRRILQRVVDGLTPAADSTVVEIGPGRGGLTDLLAPRVKRIVAIEIDRDLAAHLRSRYAGDTRVEIVEADAMDVDWGEVGGPGYLLAGNLPYSLTTPLLFKALERPLPQRAVFLVQREVAARLVATEGGKEYGALSVNVRVSTTVKIVGQVPAGAFHPAPSVDSSIVVLTPREAPLLDPREVLTFRRFVQAVFGMRRKQLIRVLREVDQLGPADAAAILDAASIDHDARPETLSPDQFVTLFRHRPRPSSLG
jgi:16S rRNA (adenine1518-N6/adenine1519-N6)-dimethyltransferase